MYGSDGPGVTGTVLAPGFPGANGAAGTPWTGGAYSPGNAELGTPGAGGGAFGFGGAPSTSGGP